MSGYRNEPIAIIGSSCRFAGSATSPSKLWELLKDPRDVLSKIDRFDADHFYHPDGHHHGTSNVRHAYMLEQDAKAFDASFFSIQAGEAESIDPRQRLMLETIYEGIESAGLTLEGLQGSDTAMFSAVMCEDASGIAFHDNESIPKYAATGTARSVGYVERRSADINLSQKMSNLGYAPVSEWDYHQFFAEAVLASPPDSRRNFEISSGCKVFDVAKEPNLPYWLDLPKFAYYRRVKANAFAEQGDKRHISVRAQLKEQTTEEGVQKVLLDRFISGLCSMLHISEEESRVTPETGLTELGIDSLVAVEIRSWFQSELDLDMPVLKILSGASIENMVDDAFERLSPELTPGVKREGKMEAEIKLGEDGYQSETLVSSGRVSETSSSDGEA